MIHRNRADRDSRPEPRDLLEVLVGGGRRTPGGDTPFQDAGGEAIQTDVEVPRASHGRNLLVDWAF